MLRTALCTIACVMFGMNTFAADDADKKKTEKEDAAVAVAEKWLALVDEGKYGDGWKEGSEVFRGAINQEDLEKALQAARKPLGKLVSRKVKDKMYATELPGAPDGEYVVIQFDTSFENKKTSVETITQMLDNYGKWLVSVYFIN